MCTDYNSWATGSAELFKAFAMAGLFGIQKKAKKKQNAFQEFVLAFQRVKKKNSFLFCGRAS